MSDMANLYSCCLMHKQLHIANKDNNFHNDKVKSPKSAD